MVLETLDLGPLGDEDVEVVVEHCGLCHSDLSVFTDEWGVSQFPAVLGHEVVGRITTLGSGTKGLRIGERVGVGWFSGSDMNCRQCMSGNHHLARRRKRRSSAIAAGSLPTSARTGPGRSRYRKD
jgi:uncharacterized zinc-type alcohol dehydrogenase-like protein